LFFFGFHTTTTFPSFSLAQRKEAKETSTYPHPLPIWRGSTENCGYRQFSDFSAVKSGIKARFCFLSAYASALAHEKYILNTQFAKS